MEGSEMYNSKRDEIIISSNVGNEYPISSKLKFIGELFFNIYMQH